MNRKKEYLSETEIRQRILYVLRIHRRLRFNDLRRLVWNYQEKCGDATKLSVRTLLDYLNKKMKVEVTRESLTHKRVFYRLNSTTLFENELSKIDRALRDVLSDEKLIAEYNRESRERFLNIKAEKKFVPLYDILRSKHEDERIREKLEQDFRDAHYGDFLAANIFEFAYNLMIELCLRDTYKQMNQQIPPYYIVPYREGNNRLMSFCVVSKTERTEMQRLMKRLFES